MSSVRLLVAIPTFRRPHELELALSGVATAIEVLGRQGHGVRAEVLVVDNDPQGTGREVALRHGARYVTEDRPGLAAVRNRVLDEAADARLLCFLDDDEVPEPEWLAALTDRWRESGAQAVAGRVLTRVSHPVDPWVAIYYVRPTRSDGQTMSAAATNNLLVDREFVAAQHLRFDERFGLSGGEDTRFTSDLVAAGGRIVWAEAALVVEDAVGERATRRWLLRRSMRMGAVDARLAAAVASPGSLARALAVTRVTFAGGAGRVVAGGVLCLIGAVRKDLSTRVNGARLGARGLGRLSTLTPFTVDEYARRHETETP